MGRQVDTGWELTAVSDMESGIGSVILISTDGEASIMVRIMEIGGKEPSDVIDTWESDHLHRRARP